MAARTSTSGWPRARHARSRARHRHRIPFTVDADGFYTKDAPGFEGARVIDDKGEKGDANERVSSRRSPSAGQSRRARPRLKHQYPHSWRSKKPVIFRNTPQWFIAMDALPATSGARRRTLRDRAGRDRRAGCRRRARTASPA
jgi:isoleucyl-tRNA synthetase